MWKEADMMKKLMFLGAGAAGYVLGAKAGRDRYDQIAEQARKLRNSPTVQDKVGQARHVARDAAGTAMDKAKEHAPGGSSSQAGGSPSVSSSPTGAAGTKSFGVGSEGA
jgi:hypothetical protein